MGKRMNRNQWATQGRIVIEELKRRPLTYRQMLNLGVGNSPWKRVAECLNEKEQLIKAKGADGLIRWSVRRAA